MSLQPGASTTLAGHLYRLTARLAETGDRQALTAAVLEAAVSALDGTVTGTLLLRDGHAGWTVAGRSGSVDGTPPDWCGSPLEATRPAGAALRAGTPLYFERPDTLTLTFPSLGAPGEPDLPAACAVLPLMVTGQALGVLSLEWAQPRDFPPEERAFLAALAAQGAVALDRAQVSSDLQRQTAALNAFLAFTETAGATSDVRILTDQAEQVLRATIPDLVGVYFESRDGRWMPQVDPDTRPSVVREVILQGTSPLTPSFAQAVAAGTTVFFDHWNGTEQQVPFTERFGAVAITPYCLGGEAVALYAAGFSGPRWSDEHRTLYLAVARSLGSALERAAVMQAKERQAALDAFVVLTEAIGTETDAVRLAERARDLMLAFLPGWSVGYYERDDQFWRARVTHVPDPELDAQLRAGVPIDTPGYAAAVRAGGPVFIDGWDAAQQQLPRTEIYGMAAFYPYYSDGEATGLFAVGSEHGQVWKEADRAVFRAVGRSLGLALDWAAQATRLRAQNQALEAFTRFTETSAETTSIPQLIQQATEVLRATLGDVSVAHYARLRDRWQATAWSEDVAPNHVAQMRLGFPLGTPRFVRATDARQAHFESNWNPAAEGLPTTSGYGAVASYPYFVDGQTVSLLSVGLRHRREWTAREQGVVRAVGRSLGLALERARQAQLLEDERAGLAAFVAFTEAVGTQSDVLALARQAAAVLRAQLGGVSVAYYERDGELWRARVWSEDISPEVRAQISVGVPAHAPDFARAVHAADGLFVDGWDAQANEVDSTDAYRAVALFPLSMLGTVHGLLVTGTQSARVWTERERSVVRAVGRGLGLALERTAFTRQVQAQRDELDARTAALSAANEELEAITYSASHDLRTPIRHVMGFAEMARRALEQDQPEKVVRSLDIVRQGATRMETLIDGMLALSRAGRQAFQPGLVGLEPLIVQAHRDAELAFPNHPVTITRRDLSPVWADPSLLQQVITHLISNAVKFSSRTERPEVTVSVETRDDSWIVTVQDNGVGFDPKYDSKLFGIFQHLHPPGEFPGTGVGLATVRRLILKHGGRVFAHSPEGGGATFGFTLPRPQDTGRAWPPGSGHP